CLECPLELRLVPRVERIVKKVCRWSGHPVEHLVEIDRVFCRRPGGEWHAALVFDIQRDAVLCYRCTDQLLYIAFGRYGSVNPGDGLSALHTGSRCGRSWHNQCHTGGTVSASLFKEDQLEAEMVHGGGIQALGHGGIGYSGK